MTVPRLQALHAYWRTSPPLHVMVAAYLGIEEKKDATAGKPDRDTTLDEFLAGASFLNGGQ